MFIPINFVCVLIFIKGTWFPSHFSLSITNGLTAWICNASEIEVQERADQWDQPVKDYIETAERYLGLRQPGSNYNFVDAGSGHKRLSWTFQKEGIKLEWRWKCRPSTNDKKTTTEILDFLMDANIRLSEEVVRKTQSFDKLKVEAEKCLAQSEKFSCEKAEFESAVYAKNVLGLLLISNSQRLRLRTTFYLA
ncbi:DNA repair protein xrcc4 [Ranunculus cassubicifolius]